MLLNVSILYHKFQAIERTLKSDNQISLHISYSDWTNVKLLNEHEALINGNYFDFISMKKESNEVLLIGNYDSLENEFYTSLKKIFTNKHSQVPTQSTFSMIFLYFENNDIFLQFLHLKNDKIKYVDFYLNKIQEIKLNKVSPPPEQLV